MTISTTLLFSRAVDLMSKQQTELASIQEKISTGKELVRPSDSPELAVNVARIKSSIDEIDSYKNSLNTVNDRLRIEETYLSGSKDALISLKQLAIQGASATTSGKDREVLALETDELISAMKNLANGTDANGNYLFAGSRVKTMPYNEDVDGTIRYQGDSFNQSIDFNANRRSSLGRNGLDIFKPVLSGQIMEPTPSIYEVNMTGTLEVGDSFMLEIDGHEFTATIKPGQTRQSLLDNFAVQVNESVLSGGLVGIEARVVDEQLQIYGVDGFNHSVLVDSSNAEAKPVDDMIASIETDEESGVSQLTLDGTMEIGDKIHLSIGSRSFSYVITGDEGLNNDKSPQAAVLQAFTNAVNASGLFSQSATIALDPLNPEQVQVSALRENIGLVQFESEDRTAINDQSIQVNLVQQPTPPIPERVEFFESLQEFSHFLRNGTQDQIQSKLDHFDQMLDIVTLSLADIGSEMGSLEDEITINEDLKLQLKTTLSGEEDLDLASAITKMQAQMMSLEAAQASFAKISQLSLFDYIR